jgi:hypothetical protein
MLGLIRTIVVYGLERGIEHCYVLVTDAFARLLRRIGVVLHSVGVATEHRGFRAPYLMGLRETAASLCDRSAITHALFARAIDAYQLCSILDNLARAPLPRPRPLTCWGSATVTQPYSHQYRPPTPTRYAQRGSMLSIA